MIPKTHITGTVFLPSGAPAAGGSLTIELTIPASVNDPATGDDHKVSGRFVAAIDEGGAVDFYLVPNESLTPGGTLYRVTYRLADGFSWAEAWNLPATPTAMSVGDVPLAQTPPDYAPPYQRLGSVDALPDASEAWHRKLLVYAPAGAAEQAVICLKGASGAYAWAEWAQGPLA